MRIIRERHPEWMQGVVEFECPICMSTLREDKRNMTPTLRNGYRWIFKCPVCGGDAAVADEFCREAEKGEQGGIQGSDGRGGCLESQQGGEADDEEAADRCLLGQCRQGVREVRVYG